MRERPLILIVDDEKNFLEIMTAKLNSAGYDVAAAKNQAEALSGAEGLMPDLILMDIHMPGETGTDAALAIRQNPKTKDIKIAFLTSLKDPWPAISGDKRKIAEELGMQDFLDKTSDLDQIVARVQDILSRK